MTAEKRETNLQRTPLAVTAINSETIKRTQTRSIEDLVGRIPSLQIAPSAGLAQLSMRGVGSNAVLPGSESAIAVNVNGVYVSRASAVLTSFYDVASIEVLRGPQGTLYGRNATAGSINIASVGPTNDLSGYGRVTIGNYHTINVEGAIGGAIVPDKFLVRIAGMSENHSGFGHNLVTGTDIDDRKAYAGRLTIVAMPTETLTATFIGDYYRQKDNSGAAHFFNQVANIGLVGGLTGPRPIFELKGGFANSKLNDIAADYDPIRYIKTWSATGIIDWDLGPVKVKSVTGYRDQKAYNFLDVSTGTPSGAFATFREPARQFSQELNLTYEDERLAATMGAFYFNETDPTVLLTTYQPFVFSGAATPLGNYISLIRALATTKTSAQALFGQASYKLFDGLSITAGLRYSNEKKDFRQSYKISFTDLLGTDPRVDNPALVPAPYVNRSVTRDAWTPKLGIEYQITPQTLAYASYTKGFRAGTFDIATNAATVPPLQPEKVTAYEGGIKMTMLDNRVRFNLAGYYYDYTNIAVTVSTNVNTIALVNGGAAEIYGLESELTVVPVDQLELQLNAAYTHATYSSDYCTVDPIRPNLPKVPMMCNGVTVTNASVNYRGNTLQNAPRYRVHAAADYTIPVSTGDLSIRGEMDYVSKIFFDSNNIFPQVQNANIKFNTFLNYQSEAGWRVGAYVRNITDRVTKTAYAVSVSLGTGKGSVSAPRTFGIELGYKF